MINIYHTVCGFPAFKYDHFPVGGERIMSKHATTLDGTPINKNAPMVCGSCGRRIQMPRFELIPPPMKVYDMASVADMQEVYGTASVDVRA